MKKLLTALAFLLCITAGAKGQTGEIGMELMWEKTYEEYSKRFDFAVFSNDGQFIYSYGNNFDSTLAKFDANTGELIHRYDNSTVIGDLRIGLGEVDQIMLTPDGRKLVAMSEVGVIYIWDVEVDNVKAINFVSYPMRDFEISPDSRFLYIGRNLWQSGHNASYSEILIYDIELDEVVGKIEGLAENKIWEINQMELSVTGDSLFVASSSFGLENDDRMENRFALINTNTRSVEEIIHERSLGLTFEISNSGNFFAINYLYDMYVYHIQDLENSILEYEYGKFHFINDSIFAIYMGKVGNDIVHRVLIYRNNELMSFTDNILQRDWDSYEDVSGFKICIAQGGSLKLFNSVITGVEDVPDSGIAFYPNPAKDKLNIKLDETSRVNSIAIYDVIGRTINTYQLNNRELNISNLPKGIYLLKIETDAGIISEKVVVE